MSVQSVGSVLGTQSNQVQQTNLNQQDLFSLLLAQLSYQDPLKPLDNQQFMAQMAQFTTLQQTQQTNDKLDSLLTFQSSTQSISLIGKQVQVQTSNGNVVGKVSTVSFSQGSPVISITKSDNSILSNISLSQIQLVQG